MPTPNNDIAILSARLSICHVSVLCRNGLTYHHTLLSTCEPNHSSCKIFQRGSTPKGTRRKRKDRSSKPERPRAGVASYEPPFPQARDLREYCNLLIWVRGEDPAAWRIRLHSSYSKQHLVFCCLWSDRTRVGVTPTNIPFPGTSLPSETNCYIMLFAANNKPSFTLTKVFIFIVGSPLQQESSATTRARKLEYRLASSSK